jgi:repressor of nif and glnA expression
MAAVDIKAEKRRLVILQLLKDDPDYKIDDELLQQLLAELGYGISAIALQGDLHILSELGLISVTDLAGCTLSVLRSRGVDVAKGLSKVPGIARPRPE